MLVFVYGTLRKNEFYHDEYLNGAELVAEQAYVFGELWDTGLGYPALVLGGQGRVYGELYRINPEILRRLDELEDYHGPGGPNEYERIELNVYADPQIYTAYAYVYPAPPARGKFLASGDWKKQRWSED